MNGHLDRHIAELTQGDHTCLIYRDAHEQMAAAKPFVMAGLRRGERCVYISDDRTTDEVMTTGVTTRLNTPGRVDGFRSRGALERLHGQDDRRAPARRAQSARA